MFLRTLTKHSPKQLRIIFLNASFVYAFMENTTMEKIAYLTKMIRLLFLEVIDLIIFFFCSVQSGVRARTI